VKRDLWLAALARRSKHLVFDYLNRAGIVSCGVDLVEEVGLRVQKKVAKRVSLPVRNWRYKSLTCFSQLPASKATHSLKNMLNTADIVRGRNVSRVASSFQGRSPQCDGVVSECDPRLIALRENCFSYPLSPVLNHHEVAGSLVYLREEQPLAIAGHR
jgi:hypothetical protein